MWGCQPHIRRCARVAHRHVGRRITVMGLPRARSPTFYRLWRLVRCQLAGLGLLLFRLLHGRSHM